MTHPALAAFGLTEAQAKTLAKLSAGQDVTGGMAGVALLKKGLVSETERGVTRGSWHQYVLSDAGIAALSTIRKMGW